MKLSVNLTIKLYKGEIIVLHFVFNKLYQLPKILLKTVQ